MPLKILVAPVGSGKTDAALSRMLRVMRVKPLARVWVLLATKRQQTMFRQRLMAAQQTSPVMFNVEFFNFYELYQRLLDMNAQPQRLLDDISRLQILRAAVGDVTNLSVFGTIAQTPGFTRILGDFIYELKQNRVEPSAYLAGAVSAKDRDLAHLYNAYQTRLIRNRLADKEGQGWLAVDALIGNPALVRSVDMLVVDGFDQFTPVQAQLLALLSEQIGEAVITMTDPTGRETTVGRRFRQALDRLHYFIDDAAFDAALESIERTATKRHPDLRHLSEQIFLPDAAGVTSSGGIRLIEAPGPAAETAAVLRSVKRLILDGAAPDDILIAVRDWQRYAAHFRTYMRAYNLPLVLHYGFPLGQVPIISALMHALQIAENNFRRRDVIALLRSAYWALDSFSGDQVDILEYISLKHRVTSGREQWQEALMAEPLVREDDADDNLNGSGHVLTVQMREHLVAKLKWLFDTLTPPSQQTLGGYINWLEQLIGVDPEQALDEGSDAEARLQFPASGVSLMARLRDPSTPAAIVARDLSALSELKRGLRVLLAGDRLFHSLEDNDAAPTIKDWSGFYTDLAQLVAASKVEARPERFGHVLVTTAADARGLPHAHVFIVGLSEGIFPAQLPEDPLYLDSERAALSARGIVLQTRAQRSADDGLFYELLSQVQESLTLSRPTVRDGQYWYPSGLWRAACAVFADADQLIMRDRLGIGQVVQAVDAASVSEVAVAVFDHEADAARSWLRSTHPEFWGQVEAGHAVETGRLTGQGAPRYAGILEDHGMRAAVAHALDPHHRWSASQLNDYAACGFRYFAGRLLKLVSLEEPEDGMDVLQLGSLYHVILEETYRQIADRGMIIEPSSQDAALELLQEIAEPLFAAAPDRFGFRASSLWVLEKKRMLRTLQSLMLRDFSEEMQAVFTKIAGIKAPRRPYLLEPAFGLSDQMGPGGRCIVDLGDGVGPVEFVGKIDRIDRIGDRVVVIDYKSGSRRIPATQLTEGRNFQMMVYLLAARAVLETYGDSLNVRGGFFWHLTDQQVSGVLTLDDDGVAMIEQGLEHAARYIALARQADFAVAPAQLDQGRCIRYCEFSKLCRISVTRPPRVPRA
ncbi:MAG: PD-(D/E)XK nuclease family protein [Chloroflexota bacterium]